MFCTFFVFVHLILSSIIRIVFGISHQPNAAGTMLLHCEQKHCHNESSQTRQMRVRMAKRNERWLMSVSHWDVDISIANREMSDRQCEHSGAAVSCRFVMNEFNIHGRIRAIFRNRYYVWYYNTFMLYCKGLLYCIFFSFWRCKFIAYFELALMVYESMISVIIDNVSYLNVLNYIIRSTTWLSLTYTI